MNDNEINEDSISITEDNTIKFLDKWKQLCENPQQETYDITVGDTTFKNCKVLPTDNFSFTIEFDDYQQGE